MKNLIFSLLPLALVSANPIERRQATEAEKADEWPILPLLLALGEKVNGNASAVTPSLIVSALPQAKLAKVEETQSPLRKTAKRLVASYGPYVLVGKNEPRPKSMGNSQDPKGQAFLDAILDGLCSDCTVLAARTRLRFENGQEVNRADGIYLHHLANYDLSKRPTLPLNRCIKLPTEKQQQFGSEFLAQADDTGSTNRVNFSVEGSATGFYIAKGDLFVSQMDLVNDNEASKTIYLDFDLEYIPGKEGMRDATATLISVTGCAEERALLEAEGAKAVVKIDPNGIAITESPKYPITADGTVLSATGHLHSGGSSMIMLINGKEVCESKAVYAKEGNQEKLVSMSQCPPSIKVKKGDDLTMRSIYDLKTHPMRKGAEHNAMGMADVMGMFYATFSVDS